MITQITFFIFSLIVTSICIKKNIITSIEMDIYKDFSLVFYGTGLMYYIVKKLLNKYSLLFNLINPKH